jgi:hypothetical protein
MLDYSHSVHQVMAYLDVALIPEFPGLMILPLFMLLSIMFAGLVRKRQRALEPDGLNKL